MPLTYFRCPSEDAELITPVKDCLEMCPRSEGRCLRLDKLHEISWDRKWEGKPSTTQLLNPTRMEYLKITKDYAIAPKSRAYAIYGSYQHKRLEIINAKLNEYPSEMKVENETNHGTLDRLEPDELNPGKWLLIDRKFWGAFAVKKLMGKDNYERWHYSMQLNDYRMKVDPEIFPISRMLWDITIRDANTKTMRELELIDPMPIIEADWIDDEIVADYFGQKSKALLEAFENDKLPELCPFQERWQGRRCRGSLCEVHMFCPEGAMINKVELQQ